MRQLWDLFFLLPLRWNDGFAFFSGSRRKRELINLVSCSLAELLPFLSARDAARFFRVYYTYSLFTVPRDFFFSSKFRSQVYREITRCGSDLLRRLAYIPRKLLVYRYPYPALFTREMTSESYSGKKEAYLLITHCRPIYAHDE